MRKILIAGLIITSTSIFTGCHDGPLYALKSINPVFRSEWSKDEELGPTDYQRRVELERLVKTMPSLPDEDQKYWLSHVEAILENDKSAEMRMLAVRCLNGYRGTEAIDLCEDHMEDESPKVRMAICDVLGARNTARSAELLGRTIGSESNDDVKMAAIRSIGAHDTDEAAQVLRIGLKSRNPAIRLASVESLQSCTGKQLGDDPKVWVAYLDGKPVEEEQGKGLTGQLQGLF